MGLSGYKRIIAPTSLLRFTEQFIQKIRNSELLALIIVLLFSGFFFLYDLDKLPLKLWDESRNAVNAFEMLQSGNMLTRTYYGEPDMYELKPPLLIWFQQLTLRIFGLNEFALRLPSAIAGILCSFLIFNFVRRQSNHWFGLIASLIFCTSLAVIGSHMFRYADHDGLLILFLTIAMISTYYLSEGEGGKWLVILPISILLAVFTKSIAGLLFLPAIVMWLLYKRQFISTLMSPAFWLTSILSAFCLILYYSAREANSEGYLEAVWNNELFNRYLNSSPDATYEDLPWWYYITSLFDRFKPMFIFPFLLIWRIYKGLTSIEYFLLLFFFSFLAIISFGSKNYWYDGPLYPILAILIAYQIYLTFKKAKGVWRSLFMLSSVTGLIFITTVAIQQMFDLSIHKDKKELYAMSYFLKESINNKTQPQANIVMHGFSHHLDFYVMVLNAEGADLNIIKPYEISENSTLLYSESKIKEVVNQRFKNDKKMIGDNCWEAVVTKRKD